MRLRYEPRPLDDSSLGLWDEEMKAFCALPDSDGQLKRLTFDSETEAVDWLHLCKSRGLSLMPSHPGLSMQIYKVDPRTGKRSDLRAVWVEAGQGDSFGYVDPPCQCPKPDCPLKRKYR